MCGIMAYVGEQSAFPILMEGLKKLEYRGYDSAGVAVMSDELRLLKKSGKVNNLEKYAPDDITIGTLGIGHTRWATHGAASDLNAHPHQSMSGRYTLVHNGIIENAAPLKEMMLKHGIVFKSETDTEVLVQLIEWYQMRFQLETQMAVQRALEYIEGSFAIVLFDLHTPDQLFVIRRGSPLVIGIGDDEYIISSDPMPIAPHTDQLIYLEEDILGVFKKGTAPSFVDAQEEMVEQTIEYLSHTYEDVMKEGYDSYMLKEINEQPARIAHMLDRHMGGRANDELLDRLPTIISDIDRIIILGCGSSRHSGLVAEYLMETYARISVEVEYASEFRYKNAMIGPKDLIIGISQSGETADTIAALKIASSSGATTIGIVNGVNSTIARMVDHVLYLHMGQEIGVASTKAFSAQLTALTLISMRIAEIRKTICQEDTDRMLLDLKNVSEHVKTALECADIIESISLDLLESRSIIFLGRGMLYPIALEGALKLKELSYIHAEGFAAGEMKHGPIALLEERMPVIALVNDDCSLEKLMSNVQEMKARKAMIIVIKSSNVTLSAGVADYIVDMPDCPAFLSPIIQSIPLQLLSYYVAKHKGCDVDQPRHLAKSVTVE